MNLIAGYYFLFFPTALSLWIVDAIVYRVTRSDRRFFATGATYALLMGAVAGTCMAMAHQPNAWTDWLQAEFFIAAGLASVTLLVLVLRGIAAGFAKLVDAIKGSNRVAL